MKHLQLVLTLCVLLFAGSFVAHGTANAQSCCDIRGDVDNSGVLPIDIGDLVYLVDYMFTAGPAPECWDEGDIDGSGVEPIDIGDLVYLVDYMFTAGPPPPDCPVSDPYVFIDEYGPGVTYEAFAGSFLEAVQISADSVYDGTQGLEVTIPDAFWSGGAFTDSAELDLSAYNALTFYAKASMAATLDVAGLGNDNTGNSKYTAEVTGLALTTDWQKYIIPIPDPAKLTAERGLFYFAEGAEEGVGYQIWMDEIIFEDVATITNIRPAIPTITLEVTQGAEVTFDGSSVTFDVGGGVDVTVASMMGYFNFSSTNEAVVSVGVDGVITAVGTGTADLTAELGSAKAAIPAAGVVTVNVSSPDPEPGTPAPTPMVPADSVISLFSDAYTDHPVDTWLTGWSSASLEDYLIGSDSTKKYTNLVFAGVEFTTTTLDASAMTHFHMDVWTPDATPGGELFRVKLVDFGADDAYSGGDDSEHEMIFDEITMSSQNWVSIDVSLASFTGLTSTANLAQMIIASDSLNTVYVDNIYFYNSGAPTEPQVAAPTPTVPADSVISLFSDAYTDHPVDTWLTVWSSANLEDYLIGSDSTKKYTNLVFAGVEFTTTTLDASAMTRFHMDVWTPDPTPGGELYRVKLVDFGADDAYSGGDDTEHEMIFDETTMSTGEWVSIDVPLSSFTGLTSTANLAQMIIGSDSLSTVFVDNIYFYQVASGPTEPTTPAPTPTWDPSNVISIYSDAYTDIAMTTYSPEWDNGAYTDETIGSDNVMKYTFWGDMWALMEYAANQDGTAMTHFHIDVWTPDETADPNIFKVKIVDFGSNGTWDGPPTDPEHEVILTETTMNTGSWVSIDLALADLTGLTEQEHLRQLVIGGSLGTVWVDNIYFYSNVPLTAAPTPTVDPDSVISIYSDAYTDIAMTTYSPEWDNGAYTDETIGTDNVMKYTFWGDMWALMEYAANQDGTAMTHLHIDVWTPDATADPNIFKIKVVDWGSNGTWDGPPTDPEHEVILTETTMNTGSWVSIDLALADLTGLTEQAHLRQLVIGGSLGTVWVDNIYFYK